MGEQCIDVFREAEKLGGIPAKARLAAIARMTSAEAAAIKDEPAIVARLRRALDQLRVEVSRRTSGTFPVVTPPSAPPASGPDPTLVVARLRKQIEAMVDLMSQRALLLGNVLDTARRVNEVSAVVLGVARVSVWLRDPAGTKITCLDLFEAKPGRHSAGIELFAREHLAYFQALDSETTIMAHDAVADFRTRSFASTYLTPLGIGAMLDVPIWSGGRIVGVTCHEHIGGSRSWTGDEERFAYCMSNFLGLAMEKDAPPRR